MRNYMLMLKSFALSLIMFGYPINFFLRDVLSIAPGSFFFTGFLLSTYLLILYLDKNIFLLKFYIPNKTLALLAISFISFSILRMITDSYYSVNYSIGKELYYYSFIIFYFIGLTINKSGLFNYISYSIAVTAALSNAIIIYSYIFLGFEPGTRVYVGTGQEGNPGIISYSAYAGVVVAIYFIFLYKEQRILFSMIHVFNLLAGLFSIIVTANRSPMLALILFLLFTIIIKFLNINANASRLKQKFFSFNPKRIMAVLTILLIVSIALFIFLRSEYKTYVIISIYSYFNYIMGAIINIKNPGAGDLSSMGRIYSFEYASDILTNEPFKLLLGLGYKHLWLDIPMLQVLIDLGIIGAILFWSLHLSILLGVLRSSNYSLIHSGYFALTGIYFLSLVNSLTHGQPYDYTHWFYYLFFVRFLYLKFASPKNAI